MIKLISKTILNETTYFHLTPEESALILKTIEDAGMLPPKTPVEHLGDGDYCGGQREWEQE